MKPSYEKEFKECCCKIESEYMRWQADMDAFKKRMHTNAKGLHTLFNASETRELVEFTDRVMGTKMESNLINVK